MQGWKAILLKRVRKATCNVDWEIFVVKKLSSITTTVEIFSSKINRRYRVITIIFTYVYKNSTYLYMYQFSSSSHNNENKTMWSLSGKTFSAENFPNLRYVYVQNTNKQVYSIYRTQNSRFLVISAVSSTARSLLFAISTSTLFMKYIHTYTQRYTSWKCSTMIYMVSITVSLWEGVGGRWVTTERRLTWLVCPCSM